MMTRSQMKTYVSIVNVTEDICKNSNDVREKVNDKAKEIRGKMKLKIDEKAEGAEAAEVPIALQELKQSSSSINAADDENLALGILITFCVLLGIILIFMLTVVYLAEEEAPMYSAQIYQIGSSLFITLFILRKLVESE